jgi:plasmid stabilization system protein ParE
MYRIYIKPQAKRDIKRVCDYIEYEQFAPIAAKRFAEGLRAKIEILKHSAHVFPISAYQDHRKYDPFARHVVYKGYAIVYGIFDDVVLVYRVIHGSLIKG